MLNFQVQVQKLNRASRLLLGALIEAYDVLQQLQVECGDGDRNVDPGVQANLDRLSMLVSNRQSTSVVTSLNQQQNNELTNTTATTSDNQQKTEPKIPEDKVSEVPDVVTVEPVLPLPDIVHNTAIIVRPPTDQAKCLSPRSHDITTKPRQNVTKAPLPDLINDSLHAIKKTTPRKSQRKVFRLNTLRDMQQQPRQSTIKEKTPSPLSWTEAGAKLRDVAATWETPRRPSLPLLGHNTNHHQLQQRRLSTLSPDTVPTHDSDDDLDSPRFRMAHKNDIDTNTMINNVLKAVQVFGLFLIIRKFENMLK